MKRPFTQAIQVPKAYLRFCLQTPVRRVTVTSFYMGKYEVTVAKNRDFCTATGRVMSGGNGSGERRPVVNANYDDGLAYCAVKRTAWRNCRLPAEAEWEYAAREGERNSRFLYSGSDNLSEVGWFVENPGGKYIELGLKKPNKLGIYNLSGNVNEFCQDYFVPYNSRDLVNPKGPQSGKARVVRGGCYLYPAERCRVSSRAGVEEEYVGTQIGFRIAY